jgi:hypothetical protein
MPDTISCTRVANSDVQVGDPVLEPVEGRLMVRPVTPTVGRIAQFAGGSCRQVRPPRDFAGITLSCAGYPEETYRLTGLAVRPG